MTSLKRENTEQTKKMDDKALCKYTHNIFQSKVKPSALTELRPRQWVYGLIQYGAAAFQGSH